jgi:tetratricopeptide (TPR) repeat protein
MISLCMLAILVSSLTIKQIHLWKDGATLWGHELDILNKRASRDYFVILTAYAQSGLAHTVNGSYENAVDDFSKAILIKSDADLLQQRAIAFAKLGRLEEAIQDLTSAISMDPKSTTLATLYYNRGTAYAKRGSFSEAIDDLSKAISLSTKPDADHYMNRGNALKKLGRFDEGERDLVEAKKIRMRNEN